MIMYQHSVLYNTGEARGQTAFTAGLYIILHHRNTIEKDAE